MFERIILITRQTRLAELVHRFNTIGQARFYIEHCGADFDLYLHEDETYRRAVKDVQRHLASFGLKTQTVDRSFLPNFLFADKDIVCAIGQDGIVANTAKYVGTQPLVGINPDPATIDGVLVTTPVHQAGDCVKQILGGTARARAVTLAEARFSDGQRMLAFNDLFIGVRTHVSARYRLDFAGASEEQSSSGIIVSTGAGSTGWLSSAFNMASAICQLEGLPPVTAERLDWSSSELLFVVREPFISKHSGARIAAGRIKPEAPLVIESHIASGGAIFSDGIEDDYIAFNAGTTATITRANHQVMLVLPESAGSLPASVGATPCVALS